MLHHLTLWVPDLARADDSWGWLLGHLGFVTERPRERVLVFRRDGSFALVLEESPDMVPGMLYSRLRPGLNHLAFELPEAATLQPVEVGAAAHGWTPIPSNAHPIAQGSQVLFLEDRDGFEVELVAPLT